MTDPKPEDWLKAYPIVDHAKSLPAGERQAYIDQACGDNAGLRAAVAQLMKSVESSSAWGEGAPLDPQDAIGNLVGESVDGFEILGLLGQGGMGTVYLARQARPRREVALKMLRAAWLDQDRQRRFQKETEVLAKLSHPHIASLFQCGTWHRPGDIAVPYFVMEYVEGARGIVRYCQEEGLDRRQRLTLLRSVLEALDYGHARGIVHRDLKPENLLVDPAGHPRVIDFGLARVVEGDDPLATRASADAGIVGTLAYMAPEQYSDAGEITVRTDVYALGLILYELLCDRPAVELKATTLPAALLELTSYEIPPPSLTIPGLPSDMDRILRKALQRDPRERYASASSLAQDLEDHLAGNPLGLAPPLPAAWVERGWHRVALALAGTLALGLLIGRVWPRASAAETGSPLEDVADGPSGEVLLLALRPSESSGTEPLVLSTVDDQRLRLPAADEGASTGTLLFRQGRHQLVGGSLELVGAGEEPGLQIGIKDGDQATVELIDTRLTATGSTHVGREAGSHGVLHIGRGSRLWTAWRAQGGWLVTAIGDIGTGELRVTDGGQLHADNVLVVGAGPNGVRPGSSSALVSGAHSQVYTWHLRIGDGHNARMEVTQGGRLIVENSIKIGGMADREGVLLVTHGGDVALIRPSREFGGLAASVGYSGTGIIRVMDGSRFLADGLVSVGMEALSRGEVLVDGASTFIAGELRLAPGFEATARIDVRGFDSRLIARKMVVGAPLSKQAEIAVGDRAQLIIESILDVASTGHLTVRDATVTCVRLQNAGNLTVEGAKLSGDLYCAEDAQVEVLTSSKPGGGLEVTGAAELAGTLRVTILPLVRERGEPIQLITAGSIEGEFSRVEFSPEVEGARVVTSTTKVTLVFD